MKIYFKLKRGILYSKTWINHQCFNFTCMFVTKEGLEYTVEWYQFIKDYTLLRRYINWMTVKLKTTEIGADIENCDLCPYVWNVHFLVWRRFKVKSLISIIFTTSCVEMNTGTLFPLNEWNMSVNPLIHCFSFLNISCSQAPFMIINSLRGGVGRWLKISIIFVKKALHNFKTDEPTSWNPICHFYKYCVCFFQGHLIIPKEGIENARVDLGGSK